MRDIGSSDHSSLYNNCCIDINGESLPIVNGYVTDPVTKARTKIEFFYLSDCEKMVHVDFDDALEEINYSLKHHKCHKSKQIVKEDSINNDNYFVYMRQKIEDLHKKIDGMMSAKEDKRLNHQRNESTVIVDVHRENEETPTNTSSESEMKKSFAKAKESSLNIKMLQQSIHRKLNESIERKDEQALVRESNPSEKSFFIPVSDLRVISKWANNNRAFLPYNGMTNVPIGTFDTDDSYVIALLCALNPVVVLQQRFSLDSQRPQFTSVHVESSGELSQEEFVKYLGLTQRKTYEESLNLLHSKKLRSKSNLALQNNQYRSSLPTPPPNNRKPHETHQVEKKVESSANKLELPKLDKQNTRKSLSRIVKNGDNVSSKLKYFKDKVKQYSYEEDKAIIDWVLSNSNVNKVNGNTIWQKLEKKQLSSLKDRTWQSLRNRFLKNILTQLKEYGLDKADTHTLIHGAQRGTLSKKKNLSILKPHYGFNVKKLDYVKTDVPPKRNEDNNKPELRSAKRKRHDVENYNSVHSDIEVLSSESLDSSVDRFKQPSRSDGKNPLTENSAYPTRSKGRKLFTQRTFVASISDSQSIG